MWSRFFLKVIKIGTLTKWIYTEEVPPSSDRQNEMGSGTKKPAKLLLQVFIYLNSKITR